MIFWNFFGPSGQKKSEITHLKGFTLIELLVVVLLLGILSVFAMGQMFNQNQFADRGFFDDTVNAVRFAQKLAVSSGCAVRVSLTAGGYVLNQRATNCIAGPFTGPVANPANRGVNYQNSQVGDLIFSPTTITFNAQGLASSDTTVTMTSSSTSYSFRVYAKTGLVDVF